MAIKFYEADKKVKLPRKIELKRYLVDLFRREATPLQSLTFIFCSDEYLLAINREFLNHDYYTDIITFSLGPTGEPIVGEIYISLDRVRENAQSAKQLFLVELHRVIFHGALHLCGFDDKTRVQRRAMTRMENAYLHSYRFM
jgi:probable rRNA maturation factor